MAVRLGHNVSKEKDKVAKKNICILKNKFKYKMV